MFFSIHPTVNSAYTKPSVSVASMPESSPFPTVGSPSVSKASTDNRTQKAESKGECQTCKERKYIDGSNEGNVSFKTPGHIAPESSAGVVRSHENEHVANAKREGNKPGNELVSANVSLKIAICPECGRSYVAGGTTRTTIKYGDSAYDKNKKASDLNALLGSNIDITL